MKLYHGSKDIVEKPLVSYGRDNLDFGKGFYCGESIEQTTSFIASFPNSSIYILKFDDYKLKILTSK